MGDSDAEMVGMIKGQLEVYINKKLDENTEMLDTKFTSFE
jgi:hypothetical protein